MPISFGQSLKKQFSILQNDKIVKESNRRGLRRKTGDLLEAAFIDLVIRLEPSLSLEVGAHEAGYSQSVKRKLPNTQTVAFEANPYVYQKYAGSFSEDIEYENLAISDRDGEVTLHIPIMLNGEKIKHINPIASVLSRNHEGFEYEAVQVPAKTLDALSEHWVVERAVAWVDVEGAQKQIIDGGKYFFSKVSVLLIELEYDEVWKGQGVASYVIDRLAESGLEMLMADSLADGQYNAVFIRPDEQNAQHAEEVVSAYLKHLNDLL